MFLEIEGVIGFLYPCSKKISRLKVLDRCYGRIPFFYDVTEKLCLLTLLRAKHFNLLMK